jgi:hypothetical protein
MLIMTGKQFKIYSFCATTGHLDALNASMVIQGLCGDGVLLTIASYSFTCPNLFRRQYRLWMESMYAAVY